MNYTFFGIQLVIRTYRQDRGSPLRDVQARLHEAISQSSQQQTLFEKRTFWKRIAALVNEQLPHFELGYWDLIRSDEAQKEFETWCAEIEGSLASEAEELGRAADEVNRLSSEGRFVLVSMLFLVERDSNSDLTVGASCDLSESDYWNRQTLSHLVATIPRLNFGTVQADAVYMMPGTREDGLSEDDLHGGGYGYLKPLV